jgi:8-oxo-dGTP pyrophosphatase MutT (NUDIX family)
MEQVNLGTHGVVAIIVNDAGEYLLLRETRELLNGAWAPPHGRCEVTDGSEEQSVVREVEEETGLIVKPLRKLLTQSADTKVKTVAFWFTESTGGELILDRSEADACDWFTPREALTLELYPGTRIFFEKIIRGEIAL